MKQITTAHTIPLIPQLTCLSAPNKTDKSRTMERDMRLIVVSIKKRFFVCFVYIFLTV